MKGVGALRKAAISTHAPHARCDAAAALKLAANVDFYSRTSCEVRRVRTPADVFGILYFYLRTSCEVRRRPGPPRSQRRKFLLTHLMRGATVPGRVHCPISQYFYSRTSCEVRRPVRTPPKTRKFLLTHLMRGATRNLGGAAASAGFLLTHLMRGATKRWAPAEGMDTDFYSRTSCEVRPANITSPWL